MLTQRQENFTLNLYKGQTEHASWGNAGYSTNYSPEVIYVNACRLANSTKIQLRLAELRSQEAASAVADVKERKERLTEIIRDEVPAQNPIQAIAELNKMEKVYESSILIDNRTQILITPDMRALASREMLEIKEEERLLKEGKNGSNKGTEEEISTRLHEEEKV